MGTINQGYFDRVRYTLYNKNLGSEIVIEPVGWETDEKEYVRDEKYLGIMSKFSNSLKFIGSGADFIQTVYDIEGINGEIRLTRDEKHPKTDEWVRTYYGYLDLTTYERLSKEGKQVSVKFNAGGLEQLLKARSNEQVEIDRLTTLDGKPLPDINPINVTLEGRRVFLKSKWELKAPNNTGEVYIESDSGNTRHQSVGVPLKLVNQSHENAHTVIVQTTGNENEGSTGMMFYAVSDRVRTLDIKLNFSFRMRVYQEDIEWAFFNINLTRYSGGIDYSPAQRIPLLSWGDKDSIFASHNQVFNASWEGQITVNVGDSLAIEALEKADLGGPGHAYLQITMSEMDGQMTMDENSFQEQTTTKALLPHEVADRLVRIYTSQENAVYSDFLGRTDIGYPVDGKGALTALAHGFWVRGFDKLPLPTEGPPKVENLFKPMTTSLNDFMTSFEAVWNVGMGIETIGFRERVRIEDKKYFFNNNVLIKLPNQIKDVKRSVATNYYFSSLEFGYEKGGDYEEACGLDEYNAKSNFTTAIKRKMDTYSKISKYRADDYGREFARRKQKSFNDTEDTPYDNDINMIALSRGVIQPYRQRKWDDDFVQIPTGVFSPETATNFILSPFNCLLRHSWFFSCGFWKDLSEYVRYGSSTANSGLKTKLQNKPEYAENGDIINTELDRARFVPEWIEFEHVCDFNVMEQVEGTTIILGKEIPNVYGLIEFENEFGDTERGYLFNLKPNGKGKWKILKANR